MMPPTSIDGTDITGATIDGQDVQEITIDGQTVFTSGPEIDNFPVAYSNLVAWYPFDSATYGGSNADDVTAIIGGSGDDTAYDGTVSGATYQSGGGVTDINAGANSGAFDFDGSDDEIDCGSPLDSTVPFTVTVWAKADSFSGNRRLVNTNDDQNGFRLIFLSQSEFATENNGDRQQVPFSDPNTGEFVHYGMVYDGSQNILYIDGQSVGSTSSNGSGSDPQNFRIGNRSGGGQGFDGIIEDVRIYDTGLSGSQINQIYQNTQP